MKSIAYIAPEIPALSATFVYNEILEMEKAGNIIIPISIHLPASLARDTHLIQLTSSTHYLYPKGIYSFLKSLLYVTYNDPKRLGGTVALLIRDFFQKNLSLKVRLGLVYRFLAACEVSVILKQYNCQHIHAHFAHVPTDIAMYASSIANTPFSFTAHANDLFVHRWLLPEKVKRSQFAVTISKYNREFIIAHNGDPKKIHVIHCGIDTARFSDHPQREPQEPFVIGSLGRFVEKKGFDILLEAAKIVKDEGLQFHLLIAGSGPQENQLRAKVEKYGLGEIVEFLGPINHSDVADWLGKIDLFILSCQRDMQGDMDGIPVVLMEAMACNTPVISTKLSGIPELITDGIEGILAEPQSEIELSASITKMLQNGEFRNNCRKNALKKIYSSFEISRIVTQLNNLIT